MAARARLESLAEAAQEGPRESLARLHDPMVEGRFADATVWPHMLQQLLFGNDAVVMLDEVQQDVEHLWLKWAWALLVAEFVELRVDCIISEQVQYSH